MVSAMLRGGLLVLLLAGAGRAGAQIAPSSRPAGVSTRELAESLRTYLAARLPTTLYEARPGWGHTERVPTGLEWTGEGLHRHVQVAHGQRNAGVWREIRVTAPNLPQTLLLAIGNVRQPEEGPTTFDVCIAFDANVAYRRQHWVAGAKLSDARARARLQVQLALACELSTTVEWQGGLLPEVVVRLRVLRANVGYEHLVVEHVAGVGGDAAKLLGDAIQEGIHQWHPSIERKLLDRANAAILKAAEQKEVRLGLSSLLAAHGRLGPPSLVPRKPASERGGTAPPP